MAGQAAGAILRGCLSGSPDNYTLTDHNGTVYHLVGASKDLQNSVGHEVQITGTPDSRRTGTPDDSAANTASSFQVTAVRDISSSCKRGEMSGSSTSSRDKGSRPMDERPPKTDVQPKGAPGEGTPPPQPEPQLIAWAQQPASTDSSSPAGQSTQSGNANQSRTSDQSQSAPSSTSTPPPVTSQTPAASESPTNPNSQLGSSPANQSGASTSSGADNQGVSNPTQTNPMATPSSSPTNPTLPQVNPNTTPTSPGQTSPQSSQNDQNKPLYERQATDAPRAGHSRSSTTTTTTTSPNGSSTTTTTTPPQH
jgi:hypothetical protein